MLPNETTRIRSLRVVFEKTFMVCESQSLWTTKCISSKDVAELLSPLTHETKEHFVCLHLDSKNKIIGYDPVSIGSLNASIVHPREVFKSVLLSSAAAVIFAHNHPSGSTNPSHEDIELTKRLHSAGELLGIRVLDHIILGSHNYYSFADSGML